MKKRLNKMLVGEWYFQTNLEHLLQAGIWVWRAWMLPQKNAKQHTDKASADATVAGKVIVNMYRTIITKFTYYINLY